MGNLGGWENKIKERRKHTPWRDFLKEIVSWKSIGLYKQGVYISKFPQSMRIKTPISCSMFIDVRDTLNNLGKEYDFSCSFFENYKSLFISFPFPNVFHFINNENCSFADEIGRAKNAYLAFSCVDSENVMYSIFVRNNCKNILNSVFVIDNSENIYASKAVAHSFHIFFSHHIINSSHIYASDKLTGCNECILCMDLENKSYCIENKQYTKEKYFQIKSMLLHEKCIFSFQNVGKGGSKNFGCTHVSGNFLVQSANVENGYYSYFIEEARNVLFYGGQDNNQNLYDVVSGAGNSRNVYGGASIGFSDNVFLSSNITGSSIYYSYFLENCSFCLGCIGLKNKSYCILNKQYTKEAWYELADKIFSQMNQDGILGDFFPGSLNPFYFNDTMAYLIDDTFTKEEVEREGYMWREEKIKVDIPEGAEIVQTEELKNYQGFDEKGNWQINQEIMKKVIVDEKGNYYKIVPMEYDFLMKHGLPLPKIHWLERIKLGFKLQ